MSSLNASSLAACVVAEKSISQRALATLAAAAKTEASAGNTLATSGLSSTMNAAAATHRPASAE
eukprot:CAMPEP_0119425338 /NCGR_PEP_ID=MMETSP1335-20130426/34330_1 /TAXON_ID=259385 /ORGANISM="Chrysoculter rhomboideus, Strain RCC1486" /LENGTH=63 /DNA_ID=CAMNT_0007450901 /DNA_START=50 /DNA_END=238 /DNA_ORIENTATION=-